MYKIYVAFRKHCICNNEGQVIKSYERIIGVCETEKMAIRSINKWNGIEWQNEDKMLGNTTDFWIEPIEFEDKQKFNEWRKEIEVFTFQDAERLQGEFLWNIKD